MCIFLFILRFQSFKGGQPSYTKKGTLPEALKVGGGVLPVQKPKIEEIIRNSGAAWVADLGGQKRVWPG